MKGTRPLNNNEIRLVSACFDGIFATRNPRFIFPWCEYWRTHHETASEIIKLG